MTKVYTVNTALDDAIVTFMKNREGRHIACANLALHFGVTTLSMRYTVERLVTAKRISDKYINGRRQFYIPTAEEKATQPAPVAREFKTYTVPAALAERTAQLQEHREQFPSFYGKGNKA